MAQPASRCRVSQPSRETQDEFRYRALGRHVALKFLPPELTRDDDARQRLVQEAKAASALDHRNICTIYDIDETPEGQLYVPMAHYGGGMLKQRLARGDVSLDDALDIWIQRADGLAEAHAAAIVHRDMKPANVVFSKTGDVKIVDFGLARVLSHVTVTQSGTTRGTPGYMSPEQVLGHDVRESTDVWSLGVVLYEMVTGTSPFRGDQAHELLYAIVHADPASITDLRPDIAPELVRIVMKTLDKDPESRYHDARGLVADLRPCREATRSGGRASPRHTGQAVDPEDETQVVASVAERSPSLARTAEEHVVGRARPLEQIREAYQAAVAGRGGIVCVTGEPGIGKTTLVETFLSEIEHGATGGRVARGRCSERLAGAEGYLPILETVESVVSGRPSAEAHMKEVTPTLVCANGPQSRGVRSIVYGDDRRCQGCVARTDEARALCLSRHPVARHAAGSVSRRPPLGRCVPLEFLGPEDLEEYLSLEFQGIGSRPTSSR